ncbi:HAD hydrolase-like protein [Pararhodospirillum oryzae]|uniref:Haloacid dehalogenase n=1 Tax=Pararhodospirillum oryzae TaxID=478448 RepID=A0A512H3T7_9PROT|nr:HAD hydrolase-like protein [Pararhodospirillum oryzae]GEO80101.1 haloacid dehalogenase [Pararhodospirillum oryzae]
MRFVSFDQAWAVVRAARPLFPPPPPPPSPGPRRVAGLADLAPAFDGIVLDAYGVLHEGNGVFPEALAAFEAVRAQGIALCVVTNDVTHPPEAVAARLAALGLPVAPDEVISGRSVLPEALAPFEDGRDFAVLGHDPGAVVERLPATRVGTYETTDLDDAAGFILVDTNDWEDDTPERRLIETLRARPRPLVVCNPDITCPFRGRLSLEPGYVAFPLAAALPPGMVRFLGKPWPGVYAQVRARFPQAPRLLAVGDSPQTDILGARGAGMAALLIENGLLRGQDSLARSAELGILPDFVAATV